MNELRRPSACLMSVEAEGRTSKELERRQRRIEAAARALHAWQSTGQWETAPATQREQFRQQALWALRAADTAEREFNRSSSDDPRSPL